MKQKYILITATFLAFLMAGYADMASAKTLKIGFITDWEYGTKDMDDKLCTKSKPYLAEVVKAINSKAPNLVIGGGDYIEGSALPTKTAETQLKTINKVFKTLNVKKRYYLAGNHDLRSLTKDEYKQTLGIDYFHKTIDTQGFRIILLDTNFQDDGGHRSAEDYVEGNVSDEELDWLEEKIDSSRYPVIIFSHHSPIRPDDRRDIKNSTAVREIIEKSGKVLAVISGHNPTQLMEEENGVRYIVVNNLVDRNARRTYAYIKASKKRSVVNFSLKQYGTNDKKYSFHKNI